ncbi:MAG: 6,7-dimethyl-8-ribityllumazine synthase [Candidatus Latescibacteria bacterium]|jgi:6,7-dimethyl-8-ribityllumazine synthase|nr:6,7-dimethyl-8-ribityllumazine synthase [Candidatus Latescibacterota bacterium]
MPKVYEGKLSAEGKRFGVVVSRFNAFIGKELLDGAQDCLQRHGADMESVDVVWVPGSFEIPVMARKMADSDRYDALICLGAVIRGSTPHFDYVANEVAKGVASAGVESGVPTLFGVLTTDTIEQAIERAGTKAGNKGWEAALGAIEMANLVGNWSQDGE